MSLSEPGLYSINGIIAFYSDNFFVINYWHVNKFCCISAYLGETLELYGLNKLQPYKITLQVGNKPLLRVIKKIVPIKIYCIKIKIISYNYLSKEGMYSLKGLDIPFSEMEFPVEQLINNKEVENIVGSVLQVEIEHTSHYHKITRILKTIP